MTDLQVRSRFLRAWARVLGAISISAPAWLRGQGPRTKLARFYVGRLLPEHIGLLHVARQGAEDIYAFSPEELLAGWIMDGTQPLNILGLSRPNLGVPSKSAGYLVDTPAPANSLDHVNIYALDDGDGWTIVDTGMGSNKTRGYGGI